MRKYYLVLLFILISIWISACSNEPSFDKEADIIGYVIGKTNDRILVVSKEAEDLSATGGVREFYNAVWLTGKADDVQIGNQVKVWYDGGVKESYPAQAAIGKIELVPVTKREGTNLDEKDVLVQIFDTDEVNMKAIKSIEINEEKGIWKVELLDLMDGKEGEVEIEDK